jgi:exodeoxyribonuclease VII small subunit
MAKTPQAAAPAVQDQAKPGFDEILSKLREAVEKLESGELSLEESLTIYEQGVGLARQGQGLLDSAQKRVELLVASSDGATSVPFAEE